MYVIDQPKSDGSNRPMKTHQLDTSIWLPKPLDEVFPFFADAHNLGEITPPWVHFQILTPKPIRMEPGALIDYRIRLHGFPVRWRTEITQWEPPHRFVDEQLRGPYRLWIHEHRFTERDGGTLVDDKVIYAAPGGDLVHSLFVRKDVEQIFAYRRERLAQLFEGTGNRAAGRREELPASAGR